MWLKNVSDRKQNVSYLTQSNKFDNKNYLTWGVGIHLLYFNHHSRGLTPLHSLIHEPTKNVLCYVSLLFLCHVVIPPQINNSLYKKNCPGNHSTNCVFCGNISAEFYKISLEMCLASALFLLNNEVAYVISYECVKSLTRQ